MKKIATFLHTNIGKDVIGIFRRYSVVPALAFSMKPTIVTVVLATIMIKNAAIDKKVDLEITKEDRVFYRSSVKWYLLFILAKVVLLLLILIYAMYFAVKYADKIEKL